MLQHAVFFDRDNTLNYDPGYIGNPDLVKLLPGVPQGITKLKNELDFKIVVISNQSGITRGRITERDVTAVNNKINEILRLEGTEVDKFYHCPFHPDFDTEEEYKCRKPSPQMVFKAAEDLKLDLNKSYFVGDKATDVLCGYNARVKTILIQTDNYDEEINILINENKSPNFVAANFTDAVNFIYNDFTGAQV
ncbi:MAG: HAD family hydrolase [Melioribacteraceae bacterium]|nr:MAG: HAD family hydrolase [Melioribacteraceae bacterium]